MSVCHNYVKYTNKSAEAENLGGFSGHIFASLARIQFEDVRPPLNLSPPSHLLTRSSSSSIVLFAHFVKMSKAVAAAFLASLQQTRWRAKFLYQLKQQILQCFVFRCLSISWTFPVAWSIGHTFRFPLCWPWALIYLKLWPSAIRFWFPKCIFVKCIRLTHLYYSNTMNQLSQ